MKRLQELYDAFTKEEKKQFLRWFTKKIWIQDKKIISIEYTDGFQGLIDRDIVRISSNWLPVHQLTRTMANLIMSISSSSCSLQIQVT